MRAWRLLFSRRWLGYLALVVVFAIACVFLSMWQLARSEEVRAADARVEANWESAPVPIEDVMPSLDRFDPERTWSPVTLTGRYLADEQLLVRSRPFQGRVGFAVLVPLQLSDGSVIAIDRGWIPAGRQQDAPDAVPPVPQGEVTVIARLKPGEPTIFGRSAPEGQLATINLPSVAELLDAPTYTGAYGVLDSESPAAASRPAAFPKPAPSESPHLSYAFQWIAFGVLAFIGLAWAIRHEYRARHEDDPDERQRAQERARKAAAKGPSDAEIEDRLLDGASSR